MSEKQKQLVEDILTASEKLPPEKQYQLLGGGAGPGHGARACGEGQKGGEVMPFTPQELAEMAAADAEIEAAALTIEDYRETDARDRAVKMERKGPKGRKVAAQQKAYYEANREKVAERQRAYREANREKYNAYLREFYRKRRQKSAAAGCARPDSGRKD